MRKIVIALAIGSASSVAFAQSSLTVFGVVDINVAHGRGSGPGSSSKTQLTNSGNAASQLGFRGVEDLGGGLSASFWLEAGLVPDDGRGAGTNTNNQTSGNPLPTAGGQGLVFGRRSTVSLEGSWGEVRLGRDYTPHYWNVALFDPFINKGVGSSQLVASSLGGVTLIRASNTIGYLLPKNSLGIYGQVQRYLGENASGTANEEDGSGMSARLGYASGNMDVAASMGKTKYATGDITTTNLGASYVLGGVRLMTQYQRDKVAGVAPDGKGWLVGFNMPVATGKVRASYSTYETNAATQPRTRKIAVGYVHSLSKRTSLYGSMGWLRNSGGAAQALNGATTAAGQNSSGFDIGISHSF